MVGTAQCPVSEPRAGEEGISIREGVRPEVGDWLHRGGLVTYVPMGRVMEARFLTDKRELHIRKEKTRMNSVMLDWNRQDQCELRSSYLCG